MKNHVFANSVKKNNTVKTSEQPSTRENYSSIPMSYESAITDSLEHSKEYYIEWFEEEMLKGDDYFIEVVYKNKCDAKG